jgi:acyl-CoA synthetase (AMP-forming)/AMP-acid ligase II
VLGIDGVSDAVVFADHSGNDDVLLHLALATSRPLSRADIVAGCREHLAPYKIPQKLSFVAHIPRSAAGKVRLADLRQLIGADHDTAKPQESR